MKYCGNCGRQIHEATIFCPHCGARQGGDRSRSYNQYGSQQNGNGGNQNGYNTAQNPFEAPKREPTYKGKFHVGWFFLGLAVPIVGLILFIVWRKSEPAKARSAGIGALAGVALNIIVEILLCLFYPGYFDYAYGEMFNLYSNYFDGLFGDGSSGGSLLPGSGDAPNSPDSTSFPGF